MHVAGTPRWRIFVSLGMRQLVVQASVGWRYPDLLPKATADSYRCVVGTSGRLSPMQQRWGRAHRHCLRKMAMGHSQAESLKSVQTLWRVTVETIAEQPTTQYLTGRQAIAWICQNLHTSFLRVVVK